MAQQSKDVSKFEPNFEINYKDLQFDKNVAEGGYGAVFRGRWKYTTVAIK